MKKKIPLEVLEIIQPFLDKKGSNFEIAQPNNFLLCFKDKDIDSDFYFNVEEFKYEKELQFKIDWKPQHKLTTANGNIWVKGGQLEDRFSNWLQLLDGYDKVKSVYDDPIIKAYSDEFYAEFEIIDEDADSSPLSTKQVLLLDSHLENIENKIEDFQSDSNKEEILQIKSDVIELRKILTKKSKKIIIKSLSKIWGKIAKQGTSLLKEFLTEGKKHVIKQAINFLYDNGMDLIQKQ
ncbi:MAG TPA: hypothetical protein PKK00_14345 [Bacteroidales bacterium]|nr:hypothetical protein [Bacteroidales bacterium]HPS18361.1 hypothetical protein [Bacteroidales bacterium]